MKKVAFAIATMMGTMWACGCSPCNLSIPKLSCCSAGVLVDLLTLLLGTATPA
jgi:hypothetical protein